jgi:hypothetical protein
MFVDDDGSESASDRLRDEILATVHPAHAAA